MIFFFFFFFFFVVGCTGFLQIVQTSSGQHIIVSHVQQQATQSQASTSSSPGESEK